MKYRIDSVAPNAHVIQQRKWWNPFWTEEGSVFTNKDHALLYIHYLKQSTEGKPKK